MEAVKTYLEKRISLIESQMREVKEKINTNPYHHILYWNIIEDAVALEYELTFLNIWLDYIKNKKIMLNLLTTGITQRIDDIERNLLGNCFGTALGPGEEPWKSNSTSPGSNRWNIIQCDCQRQERFILKKMLVIIEENQEPKYSAT